MTDPDPPPSDALWYLPTGFSPVDGDGPAGPPAGDQATITAPTRSVGPFGTAVATAPPPRRRRRPALVVGVLVALAGLTVGGWAVAGGLSGPVADPSPTVSSPATAPATPRTSTGPGGRPTPTAKTTPTPTPTPSRSTGSRSGPMPGPSDLDEADRILKKSPLYQAAPAKTLDCPDNNPAEMSLTQMRTWASATLKKCLMPYWSPAFSKSTGYTLPSPKVTVLDTKSVRTPCGDSTVTSNEAFFCPTNDTIYLWATNIRNDQPEIAVTYLVFSHEFGHHLQWAAGILDSSEAIASNNPKRRLELSRRIELQATCFGGRFLGAVAGSLSQFDPGLLQYLETGDAPGSPRTHGTTKNNRRWITTGFSAKTMSSCNTFTASTSQVA